jgi:predicted ribosomally synthesized peptide with SipW-like signal peptide
VNTTMKRRLALGAAAAATVGAVATLVAGVTFGLFSATESSGANTFTAGTVTVGAGSPTSVTCTISGMMPGDSSSGAPAGNKGGAPCTYNVKYTGSASAWLAVDVAVSNGSTVLYDGTGTGLQLYLKDASTGYVNGTTFAQQGGGAAALPAGTTSNLLVSTSPASTGAAVNFSLDYALAAAAGNGYQGGSTTVTLTFHAVQSGNNALPSGCAAGQQCNSGSGFAWS